jgi:putative ABC transport system permease protein
MFFSVKIALSSLKAHRLRASLAVVGVFLGALALTGVQHVSKAMYLKARQETAKLGTNLFIARSGQISFRRSGPARVQKETTTFTLGDATALLDGLPGAVLGAPFVTAEMPIRAAGVKIPSQIVATWPPYEAVRNFHPQYGRFLAWQDESERAKVCVLGRNIAERLFGDPEAAVGRQVFFFRAGARVIGVMEAKGADVVGTDQDDQVLVPLSTFMRRFSNRDWITGIYIQLSDPEGSAMAKAAATQILRRRHHIAPGQADDFTVLTAQDTVQLQQQALDLVQTLGRISSSISFAVGGLGILSLMVLLVRTRRLEIGLRRAVGARRRDIMRQFILEAALMAGTGGTLGVAAAGVLGLVISGLGKMPLVFDPVFLLGPLIGSVLLGVGAGAYPAWEAAHVEVLDVLRNE